MFLSAPEHNGLHGNRQDRNNARQLMGNGAWVRKIDNDKPCHMREDRDRFSQVTPHAFPESRGFTMTLEADREVSDWEYLVIRVKTTLPVEEAHTCMAAFDEEWLLDRSAAIGGTLLFDVEYA